MSKWAYWADTCDGEPCCGECDECPIKDEAIEHMSDRDCKSCKHNKPDGCSRWECEYEPRMVEVVRCKDCKWYPDGREVCQYLGWDDDFCSFGKRREP